MYAYVLLSILTLTRLSYCSGGTKIVRIVNANKRDRRLVTMFAFGTTIVMKTGRSIIVRVIGFLLEIGVSRLRMFGRLLILVLPIVCASGRYKGSCVPTFLPANVRISCVYLISGIGTLT